MQDIKEGKVEKLSPKTKQKMIAEPQTARINVRKDLHTNLPEPKKARISVRKDLHTNLPNSDKKKMANSRPGQDATIPAHFSDVLRDEESDLDDGDEMENEQAMMNDEGEMVDENEEEDMSQFDYDEVNLLDMPVLLSQADGSLLAMPGFRPQGDNGADTRTSPGRNQHPVSPLLRSQPSAPRSGVEMGPAASSPPRLDNGLDVEMEAPAAPSSPRFHIEVDDDMEAPAAPARRGAPAARGRGRGGRGMPGGRRGSRSQPRARRKDGWEPRLPMVEKYMSEQDLPPQLRESIRRILASRRANARRGKPGVHAGSANEVADEGVNEDADEDMDEDDANDMEDEFFDCEEPFVWGPASEFVGVREEFVPQKWGPTRLYRNAYEAFHSIWDDEIMAFIANNTNEYAGTMESSESFRRHWFSTNVDEIWCLFAFWMMLGIIKMPSIKSCFSKLPLLRTEVFRLLFTETRYWNLNKAFHFSEGSDPSNPLHSMGPVIDHLNVKFKELYTMEQEVCIDESLTLWKGPLGIKQYIRTKAARWGIKSFQLCESATGYLQSFFIYCGRANGVVPSSASTVLRLIRPLLDLGHTLYMDNFFNSPTLARWLKRRRTDCVGTLRGNRSHVPLEILRCPLLKGQFIARASENVLVMSMQGNKRVSCISTYHDVTQIQTEPKPGRQAEYKFKLVHDYNRGMGGVDMLDQMLEAYLIERKQCLKWTKKLFKRLINVSIQNARIIVEKSTNQKLDSLAFRLTLVQEIIDRHLSNSPRPPASVGNARHPGFPLGRLTERHFMRRIPVAQERRDQSSHRFVGRTRCVWCTRHHKRDKKTSYECEQCEMPLCLDNCFKDFHTVA